MSDQSGELRRLTPAFNPRRLRLAREARGWTQVELIEQARGGLSVAALSQIETGATRPTRSTVRLLADALGFPVAFFARRGAEADGFFRSLRSTPAGVRRQALARACLAHDLAMALERHVQLPAYGLDVLAGRTGDPQAAAVALRRHLGLGVEPIPHVVRTLEDAGVLVVRLGLDRNDIDAFSVPFHDRPVIVLGDDKAKTARSRFDAAHEVGHLLLHDVEQAGTKQIETDAHAFAAEFLMPASVFADLLPSRPEWRVMLDLKVAWGVSLQALMMRAKTLSVWSDQTYLNAIKTVAARKWRIDEPGDDELGPPEVPQLLTRSVQALRADDLDVSDIAEQAALPTDIVEGLIASADTRRKLGR